MVKGAIKLSLKLLIAVIIAVMILVIAYLGIREGIIPIQKGVFSGIKNTSENVTEIT